MAYAPSMTPAKAKKVAREVGALVEKLLAGPRTVKKRAMRKAPSKVSAYDQRQAMGPFKGKTLAQVVSAGLKTGALTEDEARRFRGVAGKAEPSRVPMVIASLRADMRNLGVRFEGT
jgi:hypothetical protein